MKPKIYRYVVRFDGGSAPRPFGGVCSLAICKPVIRRTASVGDWIVGFRSRRNGEVVFVMQVREILRLGDYWSDSRFENRKPGQSPVPDNIYFEGENGQLIQASNHVHDQGNIDTDKSGVNVLIGDRFWYFGRVSPMLPEELMHLNPYPRGYSVYKNRRDNDIYLFEQWLSLWPGGIYGMPIDSTHELDLWIEQKGNAQCLSQSIRQESSHLESEFIPLVGKRRSCSK